MKITIVLGAFLPVPPTMGGAVEKIWFELAHEFARHGHEVVMISRKIDNLPNEEVKEGVRHLRVRGFDAPRSLGLLKLFDLIYSWRTRSIVPPSDVIVTNTFWLPILRKGVYVHVARYPKGQMRFYRKAVRLQAPSRSVGQAIANEAPQLAGKVKVIPYPAPRAISLDAPPSLSQREKIILYVGRVHPEKGVHFLVEAFASEARTVFADWRLMIVGPTGEKFGGGGDSYFASLKSNNENIIFVGGIFDPVELEKTYRSARLFVYPSVAEKGESFGLAPLEAMTQGCAVLVSDLACFRDFIHDNETGFLFNHRSSHPGRELADKMENVIVDLAALSDVAENGRRESQEYARERVADQFLSDFKSIVPESNA
jgi:glycosyltransferase involved in cell wall biosynthesis